MMTRAQYLLTKLAEECVEVAQIALKAQQFGLTERRDTKTGEVGVWPTNAERVHLELDDMLAIVNMLNTEFDFGYAPSYHHIADKIDKVNKYWTYSARLGQVQP
jgi:NTP pyrophosphatase (non-canonical NTP hydrolase)